MYRQSEMSIREERVIAIVTMLMFEFGLLKEAHARRVCLWQYDNAVRSLHRIKLRARRSKS